jgi:hypothetical protein
MNEMGQVDFSIKEQLVSAMLEWSFARIVARDFLITTSL